MVTGAKAAPATATCFTPVVNWLQLPRGTYALTFAPWTSADKELEGKQDCMAGGGPTFRTLKLSVFAALFVKMSTLGSVPEIVASATAITQALYSLPLFGVCENGAI